MVSSIFWVALVITNHVSRMKIQENTRTIDITNTNPFANQSHLSSSTKPAAPLATQRKLAPLRTGTEPAATEWPRTLEDRH